MTPILTDNKPIDNYRLMKHRAIHILTLIVPLFAIFSCVREDLIDNSLSEGGSAWVELNFGFKDFENVKIETKATLDLIPESRVSNMFVFLFSGETRIYSHYFSKDEAVPDLSALREAEGEAWMLTQYTGGEEKTHGTIRIHAPKRTGSEIYLIANIDSDMLNISPEKLNLITKKSELMSLISSLNQEITSRNGLFPMAGIYLKEDNTPGYVDITDTGMFPSGKTRGDVTVQLTRFDAKINVNIRVATDYELRSTDGSTTTVQTLKEFRPESWQVVNLPKGCFITPHTDTDNAIGYFSTEPVQFETVGSESFKYNYIDSDGIQQTRTVTSELNGFSFYMLENCVDGKNSTKFSNLTQSEKFNAREQKNKDAEGQFDATNGVWTYAPEHGTYLVIKGEIVMDVDVSSEAKQQNLAADVTYYIHLGDLNKRDSEGNLSFDDYNVERNTIYNYRITIKGVKSIEVEVESSQSGKAEEVIETRPGAEGMVYTAKESIYTFDAHYGQRVFCFDAAYIDPSAVTWYVRTPFGKEGIPDKIGDVEIPSGMDYKWVNLMVNKFNTSAEYSYTTDGGITTRKASLAEPGYSHNNRAYPGDGSSSLMDIVEFTEYIKTQKKNLEEGKENSFRKEFDQDWLDWYNRQHPEATVTDPASDPNGPWFRDRIYVTIFVDEFFYDEDPITGDSDPQLWKRFVNQPNRVMHILCDNRKSIDGSSSNTGSVVTIRQRSIQTPYNIDDPDLVSAWGCETEDENADSYLWYEKEETSSDYTNKVQGNFGNTSIDNGLYNTARVWGCVSGETWVGRRWDEFLDYDRPNDYVPDGKEFSLVFLKEDKCCLRYSGIMRNRDNNGNGIIDPDELRWYNASIGQLYSLFLGEQGLNEAAKLYPRRYAAAPDETYPAGHPYAGIKKWKHHIISSTLNSSSTTPEVLWGEEAVSVSGYKQYKTEESSYSIKCVRNLGFEHRDVEYFTTDDEAHRPQSLIQVTKPEGTVTTSSVYKFDATRVNYKSKRFRTSVELEPYDEFSEMARLYEGFETGSWSPANFSNYVGLKNMLQRGNSPCPEGYRMPNLREVVLLYLFADNKYWWGYSDETGGDANTYRIYTSSYYSMGTEGNHKNEFAERNYRYNPDGTPMLDGNGNQMYYEIYRTSWNTVSPAFGNNANINLNGNASRYARCVRDWNPDTDK